MTPPDSGEREVERCRWRHAVAGQCMLRRGHDGWHESSEPGIADATVPVPLPLAQRILAALEYAVEHDDADGWADLAAELRAAVERKP
jgi:hypothetical protein